jgi:predicted site-specific integrase-resolvase
MKFAKVKNLPGQQPLISRPALAERWECHVETIKRWEREGRLHPVGLSSRLVRYRMAEILALEQAAGE